MRLSFGIGVVFIPFGLAISAEYVLAASTASRLSDIVAGVVVPWGGLSQDNSSPFGGDETPAPALSVPDDPETAAWAEPAQDHWAEGAARGGQRLADKSRGHADKAKNKSSLPSLRITADVVLKIANSGRRPTGRSVTAEGQRPAGVQVFGGSALGVGVRDGDVITKVSGVPVTSANQIIALVIAARGARQPVIVAQIYRGQRSYSLSVEQPYIIGADAPSNPPQPAPSNSPSL